MASGKLWFDDDGNLNITGDVSGDDALAELARELRRLARYAATIADGDAGAEVLRARIAALAGFAVVLTWEFTPPTGEVVTRVNTTPRHNLRPVAAVLDKVVRTTHAMTADEAEQLATTLDDYVGTYRPLASRDGRGYVVDHRTKVLLLAHTLSDLFRGIGAVNLAQEDLNNLKSQRAQAEAAVRRNNTEKHLRSLQSWDDMIRKAHEECASKGYALLPLIQTALDTVPGVDEIVAPGWDGRPPDWDTKVIKTLKRLDSVVRGTLGLWQGGGLKDFNEEFAFLIEIANTLYCRAELLTPVGRAGSESSTPAVGFTAQPAESQPGAPIEPDPYEGWLTVSRAAKISGLGTGEVSRYCDSGRLATNGLKRRDRRIDPASLTKLQDELEVAGIKVRIITRKPRTRNK